MSKRKKGKTSFSTNDKGQFIDPFTGDPLIPVKELEEATQQIPKISIKNIPPKTDDWLSEQKIPHCEMKEMQEILRGIYDEYVERERNGTLDEKTVKRNGAIIRVERRKSLNKTSICIHRDDIAALHRMCVIPTIRDDKDDSLTKVQIARKLNTSPSVGCFHKTFQSLENEFAQKSRNGTLEESPIIRRGEVVHMTFSIDKGARGNGAYYYSPKQLPLFAYLGDLALAKPNDNWKIRGQVLGTEGDRKKFVTPKHRKYLDELDKEFLEKRRNGTLERNPIMRSGYPIRMEMCAVTTNRAGGNTTQSTICYHMDDVRKIRAFSGLPMDSLLVTKKWVDRKGMAALLGGRSGKTDAFFQDIEAEFVKNERDPQLWDKPIIRNNETLQVSRRRKEENFPSLICYHVDDVDKIKKIIRIKDLPTKTNEWLNKKELAKTLEISRVQKTSPAIKVGDMDESKTPEDVKQELEEKGKNQRSK